MMDGKLFFADFRTRAFARPNVFPFPCVPDDLPPTDEIPDLFRRMIGVSRSDAERILREAWAAIEEPAVAAFRDILLETMPPYALARTAKPIFTTRVWYLVLSSPEDARRTMYVEVPDAALLGSHLAGILPDERDMAGEFFGLFAGLTSSPGYGQDFLRVESWSRYGDEARKTGTGTRPRCSSAKSPA